MSHTNNGNKPKLDTDAVVKSIITNSLLSPKERDVAFKILSHRNKSTGHCFPGLREIATFANINISAAKKLVQRLEAKGVLWIVPGQQWNRYGHGTNQYFFQADKHLLATLGYNIPKPKVVKTT